MLIYTKCSVAVSLLQFIENKMYYYCFQPVADTHPLITSHTTDKRVIEMVSIQIWTKYANFNIFLKKHGDKHGVKNDGDVRYRATTASDRTRLSWRLPLLLRFMGLLPDTQNCRCACAGNAGNVFPVTAGKQSRHASRHVRHARAVMHAGIAN